MENKQKNINLLVEEAKKAREKAYIPYSHFGVGAALLLKDGKIISGCNIENASYGLSMCAERVTLFKAVSNGYHKDDFLMMCVIGNTENPISPCGACRQVMNELLNKNTPVILANINNVTKEFTVKELIPYAFDEVENV